ncbi:uncharacterized protein TNCV_3420151 [Trichonephila clavipes]|nr:uncharacterized protein TNCV_3420151 [Trichonephila clavipes]
MTLGQQSPRVGRLLCYVTDSSELNVPKHTWTCIILGCQLSHYLEPILLYSVGQFPIPFSLMMRGRPTARCLLLVSPVFILFAQMLKTAEPKQSISYAVSEIFVPRFRIITTSCPFSNSLRPAAFPLTRKIKCKNDSLSAPEAVKHHSLLITRLPFHPDEFIENYMTDHVILNHGQVTWTTPELAPPLLTTTPTGGHFSFNVHRCPTWRVFSGTGLELVTRQATIRYLYHSATAGSIYVPRVHHPSYPHSRKFTGVRSGDLGGNGNLQRF